MLPRRLLSAGVDCRFSRGPSGPFSLLDNLTSNCRAARSPLTRARGRCTSSRNGPPTWPRANPTTEMCPRCPVNGETGETGLMMVPTRLGHREAGAARWLVCCLALAIFVPPARRTEDGPSRLASVVTRVRGREGARALWLAHRVRKRERVGVDGIDVRIADRPAAAVAEFRTPYSIK